jgi:hypothetical protein
MSFDSCRSRELAVPSEDESGSFFPSSSAFGAEDGACRAARCCTLHADVFGLIGEYDSLVKPASELGQLLERPTGIEPA